jgi:hypothetical protein
MALQRLATIVILDGSTFTFYDTDDFLEVSYNDVTDQIEVTNNGTPITNGDRLESLDQRAGRISFNVREYSFCDNRDLITFHNSVNTLFPLFPFFPYQQKQITRDSPTCTAVTCDIAKVGNPIIVKATAGSSDGSVTVSASSSVAG